MSRQRAGIAWCAVALALALGAVLAAALHAPDRLAWQRGLAYTEPWRWWSGALVHLSTRHLAANLAATAVVGALGAAAALPGRAALAWALAWPLTQGGLLLQPALQRYGGLSGVLHAGVAVALCWLLRRPGRDRWVGFALLAGLVAKLLLDAPWGPPLRAMAGWDFPVAPFAHASGAVAGGLCGWWLSRPGRGSQALAG
jgi:rhomboid family GlyGly-CTERM serine protease